MTRPSAEARKYIGQKETSGNSGFVNVAFEQEMKEEGWAKGYAWCMILARLVYVNCYPEKTEELRRVFTPSVMKTFHNLQANAYPIGNLPQVDSLVCWAQVKNGKRTGFGHAGIVTELLPNYRFKSIEGNTSSPGVREGWIVAENEHGLNMHLTNGLEILGFVQIPRPTNLPLNV